MGVEQGLNADPWVEGLVWVVDGGVYLFTLRLELSCNVTRVEV